MTSVAKEVWARIDEDAVVRRALDKGIVSQKGLAMHLVKEHKIGASIDAVISAIRRYEDSKPLDRSYEKARKVIAGSTDVRITTNIVNISVVKNKKTQELLQKVFSIVDYERGELLLAIAGEESIKIIINERNKDKVLSVFPTTAIKTVEGKLAEIDIHLPDEAIRTPGIIAELSTELTLHDVNIIETMSCLPELLFFIKQKDVSKSYQILSDMCKLG